MPLQNLDSDLLDLIAANLNSPELIFDGKVVLGLLNDAAFNTKVINAFKTNSNITRIEVKPPISAVLLQVLMIALKHTKHSIELVVNQLSTENCQRVGKELPMLSNVHALHLVQLNPEACAEIMNRLFNAKQIAALELNNLSVETIKVVMRELPNSEVSILRHNALTLDASKAVMQGLSNSKVVMFRLIQPTLSVSNIVQNDLLKSKVYVFDLIKVSAESCKVLMKGILSSKVHVLSLNQLSADACKAVMDQLPDKINLLIVINLSFDACEIVIEKLLKSKVREVKLIDLSPDAKVLMVSGLETVFAASKFEADLFFKPHEAVTVLPTSRPNGVKRDANNAGIADASASVKVVRSTVQLASSPSMTKNIIATSAIFQNPAQVDLTEMQNPEIIDASDELPQRSRKRSPDVF